MKKNKVFLFLLIFSSVSLFSQENNMEYKRFNINIATLHPHSELVDGSFLINTLSGEYLFYKNLGLGAKIGVSNPFSSKGQKSSDYQLFFSASSPVFNEKYVFLQSSIGLGYHNGFFSKKGRDGFVDLSFSLNFKVIGGFYVGIQNSSFIFFGGNTLMQSGIAVGVLLH